MYPGRQLEHNQAYIYIQKTNKREKSCALKKKKGGGERKKAQTDHILRSCFSAHTKM